MFKGAKLSRDLSVTKSCFECGIWILSVMHTASNNWKKAVILTLIQVCFLLHGHKCSVKWQKLTLLQAEAQYKAVEGEHTPH